MAQYIYQKTGWPSFLWNNERLITSLGAVRNLQGKIIGRMEDVGFALQKEATLESMTLEVLTSTEIEGEILSPAQVRSSIARRLGMDIAGLVPSDRNVDGVVDMMIDAIKNFDEALSVERLFSWHQSLFPGGRSGMYTITTGNWRNDATGPMQVVSGPMGKEKVHFQAPAASAIPQEMDLFLNWFNQEKTIDPVIKAGIVHLWFVTLHPFEDGNGRICRAITDMQLTRADGISQRYYSMSAQIRKERETYYAMLESTQKGTLDITEWLEWFLSSLLSALQSSHEALSSILNRSRFWNKYAQLPLNERQTKLLNMLLGEFKGKLNTSKWAKIGNCSKDTALRDIQDLLEKGILLKDQAGGRNTNYILKAID